MEYVLNFKIQKWMILAVIVSIIAAAFILPYVITLPDSGLDPSWKIGINLAAEKHLQFGEEIIFTFGPLGFLSEPLALNYDLFAISLIFNFLIYFFFIFGIIVLIRHFSLKWKHYLIITPILMLAVILNYKIDYIVLTTCMIFLYLSLIKDTKSKYDLIYYCTLGGFMALISFIKFNLFVGALAIIFASFLALFFKKIKLKDWSVLGLSYLTFLPLIWLVAGQKLHNFVNYFRYGFELSAGFANAMSTAAPLWIIFVCLILFISFFVILIYSIKANKNKLFLFMLLNLGLFFVVFEHGMFRYGHIFLVLGYYLVLFGIIFIMLLNDIPIKKLFFAISLIVLLLLGFSSIFVYSNSINMNTISKINEYDFNKYNLISLKHFDEVVASQKEKVRNDYSINITEEIGNKTVDIFPWDVALVWAYGFNWNPRPVFQSYTAYTQKLDELNSKHFMGNSSPEFILYSYKSIDARYPAFDEPLTLRTLLCNYKYVNTSGEFVLLEKEQGLCNESGLKFGAIEYKKSLVSKVISLIYKQSPIFISFKFKDGTFSEKFKLIQTSGNDNLLLSPYVRTKEDFISLFENKTGKEITDTKIIYDDSSK